MKLMAHSFGRALMSQMHFRMLWLTILPFLLSVAIWGLLLWWGLQPMIDWLQDFFVSYRIFGVAGSILDWVSLGALKVVIVPLIAMWVLLPLMIITALVFVGLWAVPAISRHVGSRHYPQLAQAHGGSWWGSLWTSLWCFGVFVFAWIVTLPVLIFPPLVLLLHPLLWGWLTYRVMAYDTLADYASVDERRAILLAHRKPLLLIGAIAGSMGAVPSFLWLGGPLAVVFFPLLAAVSIWLYVLVFVFTGLWFQYYCLEALRKMRTDVATTTVDSGSSAA